MATELQRPPKFQLVVDEPAGTDAVDDGAINTTNFPLNTAFRAGGADKIVVYWEAKKDGANLAGAGDTVTLELLMWSGVEQAWVVAARVDNVGWRIPAVFPCFQNPRLHFRKQGVSCANQAEGFQVWAAKLHGPLADI
jgi:hypothetical protein